MVRSLWVKGNEGMTSNHDFMRLFLPIQADLLAYILAMGVRADEADDVLQESATVMLQKFGQFQAGTQFRAWAYTIVRNEVLRSLKKTSRRLLTLSPEALQDIEYLAVTETEVPVLRLKALNVCLQKLQTQAATMIQLRYREDLSVGEIAEKLQRPADSIYTSLSRIRKTLFECIRRAENISGEPA